MFPFTLPSCFRKVSFLHVTWPTRDKNTGLESIIVILKGETLEGNIYLQCQHLWFHHQHKIKVKEKSHYDH